MKILVISHNPFSQTHNNGKTLSAIFSCFSKEELCQLYFTPIGAPDLERCNQYFKISDREAAISILRRWQCGSDQVHLDVNTLENTKRQVRHTFFLQMLRTIIWGLSSWYHGGLKEWLQRQRPEIVFFVGGDALFSHRIAVKISHKLNIPLITYFTDDYIINAPSGVYHTLLSWCYLKTIKHSELLYAIGEEMSGAYSSFYKRQFLPIMNIVEVADNPAPFHVCGDCLTISYFGGIHLGRDREIARFGRYVRVWLCEYLKKSIDINVFTFGMVSSEVEKDYSGLNIQVHPGLLGNDLSEAMSRTDIFLHVESIEPRFKALTRLSVSTKIPEYMAQNKPIIAFGPADVASFKTIAKANPQLVINDDEADSPEDSSIRTIAGVLNSKEALTCIASDNFQYAQDHFSKDVVARMFKSQIAGVLNE